MKVLFKKHVVNVGHPWEIKEVKVGYAQNFLLPKGLAVEVTPALEKQLQQTAKKEDAHRRELIENRHQIADTLNGAKLSFTLQTTDSGKVYWGIGEKDIIAAIKKCYKIELTKKHIDIPNGHIKKVGETFVFIKVGKDAMSKVLVTVTTP